MNEKLNNFFNSDDFIKALSCLDFEDDNTFNLVGMLVNYAITYNILFPDSDNISSMIEELSLFLKSKNININKFVAGQVVNEYCNTFQIDRNEAELNKVRVYEYIYNKFAIEGYYFHGFNSVFLNDIKSKGLTTGNRQWEIEELNDLNNLLIKKGVAKGLGFVFDNCQNTIFFSKRPVFSYHYASSSPEWFSIFCGEVGNIGSNNRLAYKKRDYEECLKNINTLLERKDFTLEEKKYVLFMFKKFWLMFANGKPMLALVKHIFRFGEPMYDGEYDKYMLNTGISRILHDSQLLDIKFTHDIEPDRIIYIELPRYDNIISRVRNLDENCANVSL